MRVVPMAVKGELEHPRPRNVKLVAQRADVRRDHAEILGDEWQRSQLLLDGVEEIGAGASKPLPRLRRRRPRGNVPGSREAPEMIQTEHVHVYQRGTQA